MPHPDDIAFQRAILANPADTALKLVYADWLQERDDPRAEFVRLRHQLDTRPGPHVRKSVERLLRLGSKIDPAWVAFMSSLAQPFRPITLKQGEPDSPFTEQLGHRGPVVTFESQYRSPEDWNDGLLADLTFLTRIEWGECLAGYRRTPIESFLCELTPGAESLGDDDIRTALHVEPHRWDWVTSIFEDQFLFDRREEGGEMIGAHERLKQYVAGGELWYPSLRLRQQSADGLPDVVYRVGLAVGRSRCGNRLIGALTCHAFRDL